MSGKTVLIVLSAATVMCVGSALAASQVKVNFGGDSAEPKIAATADAGSAADIVKVKARGVGANKDEALKDAYRDAVESAVGMFVDSEQMVSNDELIKDQILTQSNAYIEDYDVIDRNESDGVVEIKILARVKKQVLTKKIEGVMPAKTFKLGGELKKYHAQTTTDAKKTADGAALLAKALEGVDPIVQFLEVSLASPEGISLPEKKWRPKGFGGGKSIMV